MKNHLLARYWAVMWQQVRAPCFLSVAILLSCEWKEMDDATKKVAVIVETLALKRPREERCIVSRGRIWKEEGSVHGHRHCRDVFLK